MWDFVVVSFRKKYVVTIVSVMKVYFLLFIQIRARDPNSRWDRYMLLTYEDPPGNVKVSPFSLQRALSSIKFGQFLIFIYS